MRGPAKSPATSNRATPGSGAGAPSPSGENAVATLATAVRDSAGQPRANSASTSLAETPPWLASSAHASAVSAATATSAVADTPPTFADEAAVASPMPSCWSAARNDASNAAPPAPARADATLAGSTTGPTRRWTRTTRSLAEPVSSATLSNATCEKLRPAASANARATYSRLFASWLTPASSSCDAAYPDTVTRALQKCSVLRPAAPSSINETRSRRVAAARAVAPRSASARDASRPDASEEASPSSPSSNASSAFGSAGGLEPGTHSCVPFRATYSAGGEAASRGRRRCHVRLGEQHAEAGTADEDAGNAGSAASAAGGCDPPEGADGSVATSASRAERTSAMDAASSSPEVSAKAREGCCHPLGQSATVTTPGVVTLRWTSTRMGESERSEGNVRAWVSPPPWLNASGEGGAASNAAATSARRSHDRGRGIARRGGSGGRLTVRHRERNERAGGRAGAAEAPRELARERPSTASGRALRRASTV